MINQELDENFGPLVGVIHDQNKLLLIWRNGYSSYQLHDVLTPVTLAPFPRAILHSIAMDDTRSALLLDEDCTLQLFNASEVVRTIARIETNKISSIVSNNDASRIVYLTKAGGLVDLDVVSGAMKQLQVPLEGVRLLFSCPDRKCFGLISNAGAFYVWQFGNSRPSCRASHNFKEVRAVAEADSRGLVLLGTQEGEVILMDASCAVAGQLTSQESSIIELNVMQDGEVASIDGEGKFSRLPMAIR